MVKLIFVIIYLVIYFLGFMSVFHKFGKTNDKKEFVTNIISFVIQITILFFGGFFDVFWGK